MVLNPHNLIVLLMCLLSLTLQPTATFGMMQSLPHLTSEQTLAQFLTGHSQIDELLAKGKNSSLSRVSRRKAVAEAIKLAESANDPQLELRTLTIALEVFWPLSKTAEFERLLDRTAELSDDVRNPRFTALIQLLDARYLLRVSRPDEAIDRIKKAQASKLLPKRDLARSYNYLTFVYARRGLVRKAFDASREAINLFDDDDPAQELSHAHSNFAWMFVRAKRFDKAEQLYDEIGFGPEDKPYCWSLAARCEIALHRENFDRAMQWVQLGLEDALPAAKLSKDRKKQLKGTFYLLQSRCLYAKGEFVEAESVCEKAIKLLPVQSQRSLEAHAQLGLILAETDSPQRAIKIVSKAFDDAKALRNCRAIDRVHVQLFSSEALTRLYLENERFEEAYVQLKKTKVVRDSLTIDDLELQLKLSEMHRQNEADAQRLELIKTEERAKTAQAKLVAANAIAETEKSNVIRNVIGTVFMLTMLGVVGYWWSENWRRKVQCQLEETREQAEYQEQRAQEKRIEDIGQLTGSVAHDFNNILQVICQTDLLMENLVGEKLTGKQRELLEQKSAAVDAAAKITGQLLTYARRQSITPKVALVARMLQSTEALFDSIGDLIQVNVLNFDDTLAINVDQPQFSSAILNLLLNARDAMEGQGLVDVKVSEQLITEPNSRGLDAGEYVRVEVLDTGKGMTNQQVERACEPFFTTKPPETGKGLGLSSVKGFVEQAGGAITIRSEPEVGTVVSLCFPKVEFAEVHNSSAALESSRSSKNNRVCLDRRRQH